jgi:hypothetical protein
MDQSLGRLESVDVRDIWNNEASDFTPWLAREENLALLGETIGIELEFDSTEKGVGPFRADIVCKDTANDSLVLIENQLERTDHKHLGQLLTYGAGLNVVTIVWIADNFTEEHRAALDWLNEVTDENINLFGLEIEVWRIGDSATAPKFNVFSKPNDWTKSISGSTSRFKNIDLTDIKQLQLKYWQAFRENFVKRSKIIKPRRARPQHWMNFAIGRTKFRLIAFVNTRDNRIGIGLVLTGDNAKPHFYLLEEYKSTVEEQIGTELEWRELPNKKESRVYLRLHNADPTDKQKWNDQQKWLIENLEAFHKAFAPLIKNLDASKYDPEEDTDEL